MLNSVTFWTAEENTIYICHIAKEQLQFGENKDDRYQYLPEET